MPDADMEEPAAEDEEAMMAMMGMSGFGTTKVRLASACVSIVNP